MNTEINFLERHPKRYMAPLLYSIFLIVLLTCILTILFFQKSHYAEKRDIQTNKITEIETALRKQHIELAGERDLQQLQRDSLSIQSKAVPVIALYNHLLTLLPNQNRFAAFDKSEINKAVVKAEFKTLKEVANYVAVLVEQDFITDTQLTDVTNLGASYHATLTLRLDEDIVIKELGTDE